MTKQDKVWLIIFILFLMVIFKPVNDSIKRDELNACTHFTSPQQPLWCEDFFLQLQEDNDNAY